MPNITKFIQKNKINIVVDGQFGSTGKGSATAYIAYNNHIDLACASLSPNSGHTFFWNDKKHVVKQLPVTGVIQKRCGIFLTADSVVNLDILSKEIDEFNIDPGRVFIHPRARGES